MKPRHETCNLTLPVNNFGVLRNLHATENRMSGQLIHNHHRETETVAYSPRNSTTLHSRVLPPIINAGQQEAALIVLFGFFRTADLGRQYDTVSRVGGNFSFLFRHIHPSVYHIRGHVLSISPSRPTLVYSTPWDSPVCEPAPQVYFRFFITRGCYPRCILI